METSPMSDEEMVSRLRQHPQIRSRRVSLLAGVENADGDLKRADDAEDRLIEEKQRLGQEAMQAWAQGQVHDSEQEVRRGARAQQR